VERRDAILRDAELMRRYVVCNADGEPHLKLTPEGRCAALRGRLGGRVRCLIYHHRPSPCRRVEAGSELCLRYRREAGLSDE
jgi:Fe-S-cluster containining protein